MPALIEVGGGRGSLVADYVSAPDPDGAGEAGQPVAPARLLREPSRALRPPCGRAAQWPLISQLGLNHLSLTESGRDGPALRRLLRLYDFARTDETGKEINAVRVSGVKRVAGRVADRTRKRPGPGVCLGMEVTLEFNTEAFGGPGAFLLASVLERFLAAYVTINSFTQTVATRAGRPGEWFRWEPRSGDRTLL